MTNQMLLKKGEQILSQCSIPDAKYDAFILFQKVTGYTRTDYFLKQMSEAKEEWISEYEKLVLARKNHIPLQYITGEQEFMGIDFKVNENVLIPRQDTEILVEKVLPYVKGKDVLDMCTGSGCIAVSIALLGDVKSCMAADISKKALEVADENVRNNSAEVSLVQSDLFENIDRTFDVIVSNPPYIQRKVIEGLMEEVKKHEPYMALDGGEDGLLFYEKISRESSYYLNDCGWLFFEIGYDQKEAVMAILQKNGFTDIECVKDYSSLDRVVFGKKENNKNNI